MIIGSNVKIDLPRLLETRMLVQANSGAGKSWALRRLIEQTANKVQQIILDSEGEFATLREKYDFIICAPHDADAVAQPHTAALLARRLLETGVSAVIDIYDLKAHERQTFVKLFLEALVNVPKKLWHPVMVVLDEAHVFAPERGKSESTGAVIDIATRGRKRGQCLITATQRLSKLHKDVAAEMLNKMIGRTGLDIDVKRAADELGITPRDATATLRVLGPGTFNIFGPAFCEAVRCIKVGPVSTTHPKVGQRLMAEPPAPSKKIRKVLAELADLPQAAEQEARSLGELKTENTRLKRELTAARKQAQQAGIPEADVKRRERVSATEARRQALAEKPVPGGNPKYTKALQGILTAAQAALNSTAKSIPSPAHSRPALPISTHAIGQSLNVGTAEFRVLRALYWLKDEEITPAKTAFFSSYTVNGHFNNQMTKLRNQGLVEGWKIMDDGIELIESKDVEPKPTGAELREWLRQKLKTPVNRVLDVLIEAAGERVSVDELAMRAGYTVNGHFNNCLTKLRTLQIADGGAREGGVKAANVFFE